MDSALQLVKHINHIGNEEKSIVAGNVAILNIELPHSIRLGNLMVTGQASGIMAFLAPLRMKKP